MCGGQQSGGVGETRCCQRPSSLPVQGGGWGGRRSGRSVPCSLLPLPPGTGRPAAQSAGDEEDAVSDAGVDSVAVWGLLPLSAAVSTATASLHRVVASPPALLPLPQVCCRRPSQAVPLGPAQSGGGGGQDRHHHHRPGRQRPQEV